jgi:hypothetical protein
VESFQRGFAFLKQSWQMALADRDLIKPSLIALAAGFIVTLIFLVPLGLIGFLIGDSQFGQVLLFIVGAIMVFAQYTTTYIFSAMTIYMIYGYLAEGDGRMDKAWGIVKRDGLDILSLAAASTAVNLLNSFLRNKGRNRGGGVAAGIIETVWTEAAYLLLPVMVIEDDNLKNALKRVGQITRDNLLLIGVSTVGVKAVTGLFGFLVGAFGVVLGLVIGFGIASLAQSSTLAIVAGIVLGVLVASVFIMVAAVVSSYTATAYHTCLYLWARDVEKARQQGSPANSISAPAPLAAVLSGVGR